jgi:L-threonylcarbamoyladenylate synthase
MPEVTCNIDSAVSHLRHGKLVAFPTETVYGLGADASNPKAVQAIFRMKGRPTNHPLIVHLGSIEQWHDWAVNIPPEAYQLAEAFWPGPLTLILPKHPLVTSVVTGGKDTIGLRIPHHPVAQALLNQFSGGIAAPSANQYQHISPTRCAHVQQEFSKATDLLILRENLPTPDPVISIGLESTIVDLTHSAGEPIIRRPGHIQHHELEKVLKRAVRQDKLDISGTAPGTHALHYAPTVPCHWMPNNTLIDSIPPGICVLSHSAPFKTVPASIQLPSNAVAYGARLYDALRSLEARNPKQIWIEMVPESPDWIAVQDRLERACGKKG